MGTQIKGTNFVYEIDDQDFPGGFIASGTESFVFKGKKIALDPTGRSTLTFSCVLKFKPKTEERIKRFKEQELKIFEDLQECRSVARIYDVIDDIGDDFELNIPGTRAYIRSDNPDMSENVISCFCVVEEFIDGWSLEQYCRREFWGLEIYKEDRWVKYNEFLDVEKAEVQKKYKDEKTFLHFQEKMLLFMQSLCGILKFISTTSKTKVLHLDIKPENIMVTRQSEELVLIDFGRSVILPDGEQFVYYDDIQDVNYKNPENINSLYSHGTIGYSAPECYAHEKDGSEFPFSKDGLEIGRMSIESDIFSFGATFWECLNIVEIMTKSKLFAESPHDFYEKYLLSDSAYFNRDLSLENTGTFGGRYHESLQKIITKCTRKRTKDYLRSKNFYHNYDELMLDINDAIDSAPKVKRGEKKQVRNSFTVFGAFIGCIVFLLILAFIYRINGYRIATNNWNNLVATYQITQSDQLTDIALDRLQLANKSQKETVCKEAFDFINNDNVVTATEAEFMITVLKNIDNVDEKIKYVDNIMEHAATSDMSSIAKSVSSLNLENINDFGYDLAVAIYGVENTKDYDYTTAYNMLVSHENNPKYPEAMKHLAIALNNKGENSDVAQKIAEKTGKTRTEITEFLDKAEKEFGSKT